MGFDIKKEQIQTSSGKNNIETKCNITLNGPCKLCILLLIMISTTTTYDTLYVHTQSVHSKIVGFLESMRRRPLLGASDIHRTLASITFNMMF